jgi:large subunit ribosomal protein L9
VKVIFIEDIPHVARAGDAKEVADGYARNYLFPKKLAVLADSHASAILDSQMKRILHQRAEAETEMSALAGKLNGVEFTLKARVGAKERLYGSVTSGDIAAELSSYAGTEIDKRKIELDEPIRQLGSYEVTVRFTHEITAVIKLAVVAEGVAEEEEEAPAEAKEAKKGRARAKKSAEAKVEEGEGAEAKAETEAEAKVEEEAEVKAEAEVEAKAEAEEVKPAEPLPEAEAKAEEAEATVGEKDGEAEVKNAEPGE